MPKPLSPSAQAVLKACNDAVERLPLSSTPEQFSIVLIAAALRAAASKLREAYANEEYVDSPDDWLDSIADELEAHQ